MSDDDITPPTPERLAKGDLEKWKHTGRSVNAMPHDSLRDRGTITSEQWNDATFFRRCWNAFSRELDVKALDYTKVSEESSVDEWLSDHVTLCDHYRSMCRDFPNVNHLALSLVINQEIPMRWAAVTMGVAYGRFREYFFDGLREIKDYRKLEN